jgi:protein involved in sex pheromone biosynthesis
MKKVFMLAFVTSVLALSACTGTKSEGAGQTDADSTKVEAPAPADVVDTTATQVAADTAQVK